MQIREPDLKPLRRLLPSCLLALASLLLSPTGRGADAVPAEPAAVEPRLFAGWKVVQPDGLGDIYYFYSDGLFVRQGARRREFVTIGRWQLEGKNRLVLFDFEPLHTTLSAEDLAVSKAQKERYDLGFDRAGRMQWTSGPAFAPRQSLQRLRDLPDRTENIYWGLGTPADDARAAARPR